MAAAISAYLIILAIVIPVLTLVMSFFFLVYFSSPDDKFAAWLPKIITILGLSLACFNVLLLPMDVGNVSYEAGLENFDIVWQILFGVSALFVVVIGPFCIFYYESQDPEQTIFYQIKWAVIYTTITLVICLALFIPLYFFLGFAKLPYTFYTTSSTHATVDAAIRSVMTTECGSQCNLVDASFFVQVTPVVYIIAFLALIGWFFFLIFGGCGLFSLPIGLISMFINRPIPISEAAYAKLKNIMKGRTERLMQEADELAEKQKTMGKRKARNAMNKFEKDVIELEQDYKLLEEARHGTGSIIKYVIALICGILSIIISIAWLLHIVLYMALPVDIWNEPFLNRLFTFFDSLIPMFGAGWYGLFAFYLMASVIAGCLRISQKLSFLTIHPLIPNDTLMNSFVFNMEVFLLCSFSITQFSSSAFNQYAKFTAVDAMFRVYITNLYIFGEYFFRWYQYVFLGFALLGLLFSLIFIRDSKNDKKIETAVKNASRA